MFPYTCICYNWPSLVHRADEECRGPWKAGNRGLEARTTGWTVRTSVPNGTNGMNRQVPKGMDGMDGTTDGTNGTNASDCGTIWSFERLISAPVRDKINAISSLAYI